MGGYFIFSVPVCLDIDRTLEADDDLTIEERIHEYGQEDHVRLYGKNIKDHISAYGFEVQEYNVNDYLNISDINKYRVTQNDRIYIGKKI